jgi:hypothetical protein
MYLVLIEQKIFKKAILDLIRLLMFVCLIWGFGTLTALYAHMLACEVIISVLKASNRFL